jgi:transmembrane sensor
MTLRPPEATEQAAYWVVQLRSPDSPASTEQEFADWLRASPVHVGEYLRAVEVWEGLGHQAVHAGKSIEELLAEAAGDDLVELPLAAPQHPAPQNCAPGRSSSWSAGLRLAMAASVLGAILPLAYFGWQHFTVLDVATGVGEQRSAVLPDHSIVELNTRSEIRVTFTAAERRVELVRGEAFFEVSKDPKRPFIVSTDLAIARAVGTHFSVYRTSNGTIVTVEEGRVLVRDNQPATVSSAGMTAAVDVVEVMPGTLAEARLGRPVLMRPTNVERALAWRQRRLIFDGESLANVVNEFNRYNSSPLIIVDPRLRDQRISGVFAANDPDSLLDFLVKVDHIDVTRSEDGATRIGGSAP